MFGFRFGEDTGDHFFSSGSGCFKVGVQVAFGGFDLRVAEHILDGVQIRAGLDEHGRCRVPLRYNYDKPEKPRIQEKQMKELTRKARTRRLCTRAGMLESFLVRPEDLTDNQVMELLRIAFRDQKVRSRLEEMLQENSS